MTALNIIKGWFKTGFYPTQQQFSDTWDSFFHKSETIPAAKIENLDNRFNEKANQDAFSSHVDDLSAHGKHGNFEVIDGGQASISIPHGLGNIPTYWNIRGKNTDAKNVVNISIESADETNLILTPDFMNNDGQTLIFLWEAKL